VDVLLCSGWAADEAEATKLTVLKVHHSFQEGVWLVMVRVVRLIFKLGWFIPFLVLI
jgi:hypothetical protein